MTFVATKQHVLNRGTPPDSFLEELVIWGKSAVEDIFSPNSESDVYSSVHNTLGPYPDNNFRRCVMLEVMRVLAGFESSWNWHEGIDQDNPNKANPASDEAGAWQVSADSMALGPELRGLVQRVVGSTAPLTFQYNMKVNHPLAMEYIARLLRRTTKENGPVLRCEINPWLRRNAVAEFAELLK